MAAAARTVARIASSEFVDLMDQLRAIEMNMGIAQRIVERVPVPAIATQDFQGVLDAIDRISLKLEALRATLTAAA